MGYEVYALGPYDAVYGLPELVTMAAGKSFRLICSNLSASANVDIDPYALIQKGDKRVLVTSIVDPWLAQVRKEKKGIVLPVDPPEKILSHIFATVPHDLSILVVHTAKPHLEKLLSRLKVKPDLVVLGYQDGVFPPQPLSDGCYWVANNNSGKTLCAVDLAKNEAECYTPTWLHKTLRMDSIVPEPHIDQLIIEQEKWEKEYLRWQSNQKNKSGVRVKNFYLGAEWCTRCHGEIAKKWNKSRHADAITILKQQGHEDDLRCLPCHVTGMALEGPQRATDMGSGFVSLEKTPHLANVQCEACHGPGKLHVLQPHKNKMPRGDSQTCLKCHTEETSPDFIYDLGKVH